MLRRQMSVMAWGQAFKKLAEVRGIKLGQASSADKRWHESATVADLAKSVGVSPRTARRRLEWAEILESEPKLGDQVKKGELSAKRSLLATIRGLRRGGDR